MSAARSKMPWIPAVERICTRCGGHRWPVVSIEPFVCHRCRAVLAGKNAEDPLGTSAQRAQRARVLRRPPPGAPSLGKKARRSLREG